jgi:serine/threonine-protein kinase
MDAGTPEEILKVMDFGLAKLSAAPHIRLEKLKGDDRDVATGTPEYMSSEQARGAEVDHRADLYSVGVILYELLTGTLPFVRKSIPELLQAHVEDPPPPFNKVGAGGLVPSAVESVVLWCLSKFPNERPQTAWELALKYEKAVGQKVLAGIQPPAPPTSRPAVAALAPKKPVDPNATVYSLEAWMPEAIAVIKLRGFVEDAHGEVLASEPGVVKVKLGQADCKYRVGPPPPPPKKGWFGTVSAAPPAPANPIDMELQMTKPPGAQNLSITVVIKPGRGSTIRRTSPDWHRCCELIFRDLKAYFMSK